MHIVSEPRGHFLLQEHGFDARHSGCIEQIGSLMDEKEIWELAPAHIRTAFSIYILWSNVFLSC